MTQIPTAEELFDKYCGVYTFEEGDSEHLIDEEDFKKAMIEFAKIHVQAALDAAENSDYLLNDDSITNAYPLTNIK